MYGRRTGRIEKIIRKWGLFMSAILKQKLIDIANGFTKYGLWKGGGSGGSSALSEMTDVSFSNLKENNILKYNGSVWVNGDNLHEYSTEEKIVGKWIDGKPIYEKTYVLNNIKLLSGGNTIFDTIENVKIINSKGIISDATRSFSIPYADGGGYVMCVQSNNEIGLWSNNGFYNQTANIILTIQYIRDVYTSLISFL